MVFYMADGTTVSTAPKFTGSSYLDTASGNVGTILGVETRTCPSSKNCCAYGERNTRVT
jgi:hypothetical protein